MVDNIVVGLEDAAGEPVISAVCNLRSLWPLCLRLIDKSGQLQSPSIPTSSMRSAKDSNLEQIL
jgi:hypothetical protein